MAIKSIEDKSRAMEAVTCYPSPGKAKGLRLAQAFAEGSGGQVASVGETKLQPGAAFFYGMTPHSLALIAQSRAEGRSWYYADNAYYFGRGSYFRVTRNALQHDGRGPGDPVRLARFGLTIKPWRAAGRQIVITTQSELFYRLRLGTTRETWVARLRAGLARHSERPVVVCDKPEPRASDNAAAAPGFEAALAGAHALVTHSSSSAVKALIEGVPVFCLGVCAAARMGRRDLAAIEDPVYPPDRAAWLATLAANQWTQEELRDGTCWRTLNGFR